MHIKIFFQLILLYEICHLGCNWFVVIFYYFTAKNFKMSEMIITLLNPFPLLTFYSVDKSALIVKYCTQ